MDDEIVRLIGINQSSFCLLILINGSNFIDGLNGLLISYSLIVIYKLGNLGLINDQIILLNSYHCSKYNINTKRLKITDLDYIFKLIKKLLNL